MAFNINAKVFNFYAVATTLVLTISACGGGGGTSSSAGGGAAGTATVAGVVDNGGLASLEVWHGNGNTGEKIVASLAEWVSTPVRAAPVSGVQVDLACTGADSGFSDTQTTGPDGSFLFVNVPPNLSCDLTFDGQGGVTVNTEPGSVTTINVTFNGDTIVSSDVKAQETPDDPNGGFTISGDVSSKNNDNGNDNVSMDDDSSAEEDSVSTASSDDGSGSEDSRSAANNDNTDPGTENDNSTGQSA